MGLVGRSAELRELDRLLGRTADGAGGLVTVVGPAGSGKTALVAAVADRARARGFEVLAASPVLGKPGRLVWAQLLHDAGASDVDAFLAGTGSLDASVAVQTLTAGTRRLILVDAVDAGGPAAIEILALVAARLVASSTAVVVTACAPLGLGPELVLTGLDDLAELLPEVPAEWLPAIHVASRGMPGPALVLARQLADRPPDRDPLVHLALHASAREEFLAVDDALIRLLERALSQADDGRDRARLLARLARELLSDPLAANRRRDLIDQAVALAPRDADVLDARLHALWDPDGAADRLASASEIIELARSSGDAARERNGLFWRFVALMELARVDEAEVALAAFDRAATTAGDGDGSVMALSRYAMLATLRGQFDSALALADEVAERARQIGLPDAERLVDAIRGGVVIEWGDETTWLAGLANFQRLARRLPGHLFEATAAGILVALGRRAEADAELERMLPRVLAASGPRWLGAVAQLGRVAVETRNTGAAARLYDALRPYNGRLVVWGGANATDGPVSHYLGRLALLLGWPERAVEHLQEAAALEESIGALPALAHTLAALGDALTARGDVARAAELHRRAGDLANRLAMTVVLPVPADEWTLRRDEDGWVLEAGDERARLADSLGLHHLRALLAVPGRDIPALDLVAGGAVPPPGTAPLLDAAAVAAYRRRLADLAAEMDAADAAGDATRGARADEEHRLVLAELRRATGRGGRVRRTTAESERARVNVTRTLRAALDRIAVGAPKAGAHLHASIRTGLACRYEPADGGPARWRV